MQEYVKFVINDIIDAADFIGKMNIRNEVALQNVRPDCMIIHGNRNCNCNGSGIMNKFKTFPICVIDVKMETSQSLNNPLVLGELFDYMLQLRMLHGVIDVFGILHNGEFVGFLTRTMQLLLEMMVTNKAVSFNYIDRKLMGTKLYSYSGPVKCNS